MLCDMSKYAHFIFISQWTLSKYSQEPMFTWYIYSDRTVDSCFFIVLKYSWLCRLPVSLLDTAWLSQVNEMSHSLRTTSQKRLIYVVNVCLVHHRLISQVYTSPEQIGKGTQYICAVLIWCLSINMSPFWYGTLCIYIYDTIFNTVKADLRDHCHERPPDL